MGQKPEEVGTEGPQGGTEDPAGTSPPSEPTQPSVDQLLKENRELRDDVRTERAERLVERHDLPEAFIPLLKDVPRDQQEDRATELKGQLDAKYGKPGGEAPPGAEGDKPPEGEKPPEEPGKKPELAAVDQSGADGGTPPAPPAEGKSAYSETIRGAKDWTDLERRQAEAQAGRGK